MRFVKHACALVLAYASVHHALSLQTPGDDDRYPPHRHNHYHHGYHYNGYDHPLPQPDLNQEPYYYQAQQPYYHQAQQPYYHQAQQPYYHQVQQPNYHQAQQPQYGHQLAPQPAQQNESVGTATVIGGICFLVLLIGLLSSAQNWAAPMIRNFVSEILAVVNLVLVVLWIMGKRQAVPVRGILLVLSLVYCGTELGALLAVAGTLYGFFNAVRIFHRIWDGGDDDPVPIREHNGRRF